MRDNIVCEDGSQLQLMQAQNGRQSEAPPPQAPPPSVTDRPQTQSPWQGECCPPSGSAAPAQSTSDIRLYVMSVTYTSLHQAVLRSSQ